MLKETITAGFYWDTMLKASLRATGYLPKDLYYLPARCEELHKYITPEIIRNWYADEYNLDWALEEILYTRGVHTGHFTQSVNVNDLEDCIAKHYCIKELRVNDYDETATIIVDEEAMMKGDL